MPVYNKRGILLLPKVIVLNPKDGNGYMKTGWIHWNEKDYFCDETGAMLVNTVTPDGASVGEDGARL